MVSCTLHAVIRSGLLAAGSGLFAAGLSPGLLLLALSITSAFVDPSTKKTTMEKLARAGKRMGSHASVTTVKSSWHHASLR